MAILWVYLPRYSTTDLGLQKAFWQNDPLFLPKLFLDSSIIIGLFACKAAQYLAQTLDNALTGNKNLPSPLIFFQLLFYQPRRLVRCSVCGCRTGSVPSVQNRNHPSWISLAFPKLFKVAASKKQIINQSRILHG
jgi:hypothetical protein